MNYAIKDMVQAETFANDIWMVFVIDGIVCLPCSAMIAFSACSQTASEKMKCMQSKAPSILGR